MDLKTRRVMVTGGAGFLGSYLVGALRARGCTEELFGFRAETEFPEGLRRTVDWYIRRSSAQEA